MDSINTDKIKEEYPKAYKKAQEYFSKIIDSIDVDHLLIYAPKSLYEFLIKKIYIFLLYIKRRVVGDGMQDIVLMMQIIDWKQNRQLMWQHLKNWRKFYELEN